MGGIWNKCISNMYLKYKKKIRILYLYLNTLKESVFYIYILYLVSQCILYFENIFDSKYFFFIVVGRTNKFLRHGH